MLLATVLETWVPIEGTYEDE